MSATAPIYPLQKARVIQMLLTTLTGRSFQICHPDLYVAQGFFSQEIQHSEESSSSRVCFPSFLLQ